jgi:hypothetical protein
MARAALFILELIIGRHAEDITARCDTVRGHRVGSIALALTGRNSDMMLRENVQDFFKRPERFVRAPEYLLGVVTMAWGIVLAIPVAIFDGAPAWATLQSTNVPESAWGAAFFLLGLVKFVAVCKRWLPVRRATTFLGLAAWSGVSLSFFLINPYSPGWAVYSLGLGGLNGLVFLRLSQKGAP